MIPELHGEAEQKRVLLLQESGDAEKESTPPDMATGKRPRWASARFGKGLSHWTADELAGSGGRGGRGPQGAGRRERRARMRRRETGEGSVTATGSERRRCTDWARGAGRRLGQRTSEDYVVREAQREAVLWPPSRTRETGWRLFW